MLNPFPVVKLQINIFGTFINYTKIGYNLHINNISNKIELF